MKKLTVGILLLLFYQPVFGLNAALHQRLFGFYIGENISVSPYKTYGSFYLNFQRHARIRAIEPQQEHLLYKHLLKRILLPRFVLLQATISPLATASSFLETDDPSLFGRFKLYPGLNWFKAISTGPEEPYALSLFLGNITFFSRDAKVSTERRQMGSALAGLVFSAGHWHILDNIRIDDRWYEIELALTGRFQDQQNTKLTWDFRLGYKAHENPLAFNVAVLTLNRSQSDWRFKKWSVIKNSEVNTTFNFPVGDDARNRPFVSRIYFIFSKKYPVTLFQRTWLLKLGAGFVHARHRRFDRGLREFDSRETGKFIWLVKPNIEF